MAFKLSVIHEVEKAKWPTSKLNPCTGFRAEPLFYLGCENTVP